MILNVCRFYAEFLPNRFFDFDREPSLNSEVTFWGLSSSFLSDLICFYYEVQLVAKIKAIGREKIKVLIAE